MEKVVVGYLHRKRRRVMMFSSTIVLLMMIMILPVALGDSGGFFCPNAFWVFGDSLSDTGNTFATFPFNPETVLNPPYGESYTFTDKPGRNRYSNGRLVIDFIAQSFNFPFFGSYVHALNGENYLNGANFAFAGAQARADATITPFYLQLQTNMFQYFKDNALAQGPYFKGVLLPAFGITSFTRGAYIIPEIGGNDFTVATSGGLSPSVIISQLVPVVLAAVQQAVIKLHDTGARLIVLFNIPPQGCNAMALTLLSSGPYNATDNLGCLDEYNAIDRAYNAQLNQTLIALQQNYSSDGTRIYLFDYYSATIEIFSNKAKYGFTNTLQACCGYGPPYNYNPYVTCGNNGSVPTNSTNYVNINTACGNPDTYTQWDGEHFTQAFNRQVATFFLDGQFVTPPLNLTKSCYLNFLQFYQNS